MRTTHREGQDQGAAVRHPLHPRQAGGGAGRLSTAGRRALTLYGIAAGVLILDRLTKVLAERNLPGNPIELIPGVLDLRYTTNPGGAFGLFDGIPWLFVVISIGVIGVIVAASRRLPTTASAAGLGLVLGGAIGNLIDRAIRGPGFSGEVVDFIDLQVWPIFNLADSAIVIGAGLLLLAGLRRSPKR
ncbi:MAG: signal peptidase II [Actinomycetota bacterium]